MDEDDDMLPIALEPQLNEDNDETLTALQSHEQRLRDDGVGMTYEDLCKAHIVSFFNFFILNQMWFATFCQIWPRYRRNNTPVQRSNTFNKQRCLSALRIGTQS